MARRLRPRLDTIPDRPAALQQGHRHLDTVLAGPQPRLPRARPHRTCTSSSSTPQSPARRAAARSNGSSAPSPPNCFPTCPGTWSAAKRRAGRGSRCRSSTPRSAGGSPAPTTNGRTARPPSRRSRPGSATAGYQRPRPVAVDVRPQPLLPPAVCTSPGPGWATPPLTTTRCCSSSSTPGTRPRSRRPSDPRPRSSTSSSSSRSLNSPFRRSSPSAQPGPGWPSGEMASTCR